MSAPSSSSPESESVDQAAGQWLARRDRGLTAAEQDEYLQWLRQDPRHGTAMAQLDSTWGRLDTLAALRPAHSTEPDPKLLAPGTNVRRAASSWRWGVLSTAGAAAAVMIVATWWNSQPTPAHQPPLPTDGIVRHETRRMTLPDGSIVRLNTGATVELAFVSDQRRVILVEGAAHFDVMKDVSRPFIVDAGAVTVRAVGTGFNVARDPDHITVHVTEGSVSVDRESATAAAPLHEKAILTAGERVVILTNGRSPLPVVTVATPLEIEHDLAWQSLRLEFAEIPLAQVVEEFNRYNQRKLEVGDASAGALRVGGTFRADNVDAFVRLLEAGFGVTATQRSDGVTVLSRR